MVEPTMDPVVWLRKQLEEADVDLLREMVRTFIQGLMAGVLGDMGRGLLGPVGYRNAIGRLTSTDEFLYPRRWGAATHPYW